ncbi:hypothetical protein E4U33_004573 [Claviceps sp. LM78 group G4]|nr:hypothetical protein E4U33_004573 [Claviceps sp. LM78 group G4]
MDVCTPYSWVNVLPTTGELDPGPWTLVALGSQISLIVNMERNTGNDTGSGKEPSPYEKAAL